LIERSGAVLYSGCAVADIPQSGIAQGFTFGFTVA
jgi:hypothetical protein